MSNINKLYAHYNVQTDIEKKNLKDLLENYLPNDYASTVQQRLADEGIDVELHDIYNVKRGRSKNLEIFDVILKLTQEQKVIADRIKSTLNPDFKKAV
jgi:predicted transcriptional regulator